MKATRFDTVEILGAALLARTVDTAELDPFCEHEDRFIDVLRDRFGKEREGIDWEVLNLSAACYTTSRYSSMRFGAPNRRWRR